MSTLVQVLLIQPDLSEVLLHRDVAGLQPPTLEVPVSPASSDGEMKQALFLALHEKTGVKIRDIHWTRVERQAADATPLYVTVTNLAAISSVTLASEGWQCLDLKQSKANAFLGNEGFTGLASVFRDVDANNGACQVMLEGLLRHLSKNVQTNQMYWLGARQADVDQTAKYCCECCQEKVDELNWKHPDGDFFVDGGWGQESDYFPDCEKCGMLLDATPADHCVESAVAHYVAHGIKFDDDYADRLAYRMRDLIETYSLRFLPVFNALLDMIRRGERSVPKKRLAHIPLDDNVAAFAKLQNIEKLKNALEAGGSPDAVDFNRGFCALRWAVEKNNPEMARVLLDAGADPYEADYTGFSPIELARKLKDPSMANLMFGYHACVVAEKAIHAVPGQLRPL